MLSRRLKMLQQPIPLIVGLALGAASAVAVTRSTEPRPAISAPQSQLHPKVQESIQTLRSFSETFTSVAESSRPAVVSILVEKRQENPYRRLPFGHPGANPFEGTPFSPFFNGPQGGQDEAPSVQGGGTGMIIRDNGLILTNNHVIEGADTIKVKLNDGREFMGTVKGTDPRTDLAVVKIDAKSLPTVKLGDSDQTRVGEWVVAMGNPYGFDYTVTAGIVSAKGRRVTGGEKYEDFIQTDASINPGNSGGPLLNLSGEVIAINTMIAGIGTGIGFAIPSNLARDVSSQLIDSGKVVRPWLGVGIQSLTDDMAQSLKLDKKSGVIVNQVHPGSPAEKAGLQRGDVVTSVDGAAIPDADALVKSVLQHKIGDKVTVEILRDGKEKKLQLVTEAMPEKGGAGGAANPPGVSGKVETLGLDVEPVSDDLARKLGMRSREGMVITQVVEQSPAGRAGLRQGDVVLEVNRRPVNSLLDFSEAVQQSENAVLLLVSREGSTFFIPVRLR